MPRVNTFRTLLLFLQATALWGSEANALGEPKYVHTSAKPGDFILAESSRIAPLVASDKDWVGVIRAAGDLSQDVGRVTGRLFVQAAPSEKG